MARKYDLISELYERTCFAVTDNPANWQNFLKTAGHNFRLRFDEQLLIYAQRPSAIAVLEIEKWNHTFGRWVNRGATGIAVFENFGGVRQRLTHYFDISDTHESRYSRPVPLWEMNERYENEVIETLENTFGEVSDKTDFGQVIIDSVSNAVDDNIADYLGDFGSVTFDSNIDDSEQKYITLVKNSVSYMIMARLGVDADKYFTVNDFETIKEFKGQDTLNAIGFATSDIAEMGLMPISRTINASERQNRTFDRNRQSEYNKGNENTERGNLNETDRIHNGGRLQPAEPSTSGSTRSDTGQMVTDEREISQGTSQNPILQSANEGQDDRTSSRDSRESNRTGGIVSNTDGEGNGTYREDEGNGYDELGTDNEQSSSFSSGNRDEASDLRSLDGKPLPSVNEQMELFERAEETTSPAFSIPQEVITATLKQGSGFVNGKMRIYEQFQKSFSVKENADFLKHEYGIGGSTHAGGFAGYGQDHDAKGLEIYKGYADDRPRVLLKWNEVAKQIGELIAQDRYLNDKEKEQYPKWLEETEIKRAEIEAMKRNREILNSAPPMETTSSATDDIVGKEVTIDGMTFVIERYDKWSGDVSMCPTEGFPINRVEKIDFVRQFLDTPVQEDKEIIEANTVSNYEYHLGDVVYIGSEKYEILSFDENRIMLYDYEMPLFNKEFTRADFDEKVRENPLNDHLIVKEVVQEKESDLAERLVDFMKDYDHYNYQDNLEIGQTDVDVIETVRENLNDSEYVSGIIEYLNNSIEDTDRESLDLPIMEKLIEELTPLVNTVQSNELLSQAKELIDEYCREEFERDEGADYEDLTNVGVAYTTTEDGEHEIQASIDLVNNKIETYVDNVIVRTVQYDTLGELIDKELFGLSFNELTYVTDEEIEIAAKANEPEMIDTNIGSMPIEDYREIVAMQHGFDSYEEMRDEGIDIDIGNHSNDELSILEDVLSRLKMEDTTLSFDDNGLVARDSDNEWHNAEFYHFLVDEAFVFNDDGSIELVDGKLFDDFNKLCDKYGVEIKSNRVTAPVVPAWEQKKKSRVQSFDLHPDVPMADRNTFDLRNNPVEEVGKKERFKRNMAAIRVLKECEFDNRFAIPEEQEILSKYVGWGGMPEAFDENNSSWANEFVELYGALSPEEYASARESTLTAFYTPPAVSSAIYKAMEQMGFKEGNLLEPSCGTGNFIGMLPKSMENAKVYGIELDTISAGIAQQLYQKSSIASQGFEEVNVPDSFFDGVIGNVPFGDFKVLDKRYDKHNFLIHDYFFAKSLDKLRPGGVMALVTSKGTLDKENSKVRKYIAQRAELLGAIRLPNDTFKGNAGTEVVSDILFLQKRDRLIDIEPDWVHLDTSEDGIRMNSYFVEHPEMILGEMKMVSGRFGMEATCEPYENADLESQLDEAIQNIHAEITEYELEDDLEEDNSIPADPTVRNFSYTVLDDVIYFRENSRMNPVETSATAGNRIKGMIGIREAVRTLIELQTEDYPDDDIKAAMEVLNDKYETFTKKYGLINSRANTSAFGDDSSYSLLSALEIINENGELERKADMFYKRTIKPHTPVTEVDTADEALAVSMGEKASVDMEYMESLTGKSEQELFSELKGAIFLNPNYQFGNSSENKYVMADEYLSGNVREKLAIAKRSAELYPEDYKVNVEALEKVQPKDLTASEISVRLGATWLPPEIVQEYMFEFLETPRYAQWNIKVHFSPFTSEWNIEGKSYDRGNVKANSTYGTSRINAYKIIEETLNLKDVRIFDYVEDEDGKKKAVLNKRETAIAQAKQELIKQGFTDWVWNDPERRERLTKLYNEKFNSIRPREYDGSHITFNGMNPEINLREHQRNAVAHILYGGNTLLAHAVGAGKTFEMVAASQESKRLGLCNKSLFVVPNHLTEQWAAEYLQLYPAANILVATKKDFETKNRKKFCGRIATGDYDAVIIGHSQFEKIPMSIERQKAILQQQIDELTEGITELKRNRGERFSIKQLEKSKKSISQKLEKLNDQSRKDDVVTFEELGVDRLFIDESHYYKNLYLYTKMRNVGGIAQTEAQKSSDLFMKCRYLDEITGGRGTVFATGTPISNSMVELYTIQRYLQYGTLVKNNLQHFDAWASTFGETVTAVELTPEGTGYRAKTRFAKFYNLPELMAMFKEVADIKTADMLNLPVPKANFHNVAVKPSEMQKEMVASLSERAEAVRGGGVDSSVDNMLKITNDGRKLALDQRMLNDMLPDFEGSKINACVDNIYRIWNETKDEKSAQLVFCDLSTPKNDGSFNVYDDVRKKLIERGVPESEVRFIHEADTDMKKKDLFQKTRKGEVRVLLGSTQKMGAGTNVQDKLIALHDIDCPWRPSDLEQRSGRIIRQGNQNPEVNIYRYVTEQTFDAYLYQLVEGKQKFASQIMTSKSPVRSAEDIDETALSYAEIKMLATGNPYIKEKMDLDIQVQKLKLLKSNFLSEKYQLEDKIIKYYPQRISALESRIEGLKKDVATVNANPKPLDDQFVGMKVLGIFYGEKADAGKAIIEACKTMTSPEPIPLGEYRGFKTELAFNTLDRSYEVKLKGETSRSVSLGEDPFGNITRIDNGVERFAEILSDTEYELDNTKKQFETAKLEVEKPFIHEEELKGKLARLDELNILLNMDKTENEIVGGEPDEGDEVLNKKPKDKER